MIMVVVGRVVVLMMSVHMCLERLLYTMLHTWLFIRHPPNLHADPVSVVPLWLPPYTPLNPHTK